MTKSRLDDMEKKVIPIKFFVDQPTFESIIKYANKHRLLIPDLMRWLIEVKFDDGTFESRIKIKKQIDPILSFDNLDVDF